jgi:hypothetical protein
VCPFQGGKELAIPRDWRRFRHPIAGLFRCPGGLFPWVALLRFAFAKKYGTHIFQSEHELQNIPEAAPKASPSFSGSEKLARYSSSALSGLEHLTLLVGKESVCRGSPDFANQHARSCYCRSVIRPSARLFQLQRSGYDLTILRVFPFFLYSGFCGRIQRNNCRPTLRRGE